jgi:ubiquinone/menaquinone biosynthesis C-methylase UbiE
MKKSVNIPHTCPWWFIYSFDNPLRKLFHDPPAILEPYVKPGNIVLDVGCGMGYFTIALARLVGQNGKVIALDLQKEMLQGVRRRARRGGLLERIQTLQGSLGHLGVDCELDFALAFWMVHEVHEPQGFFIDLYNLLKPAGRLLLVEPRGHVSQAAFDQTISLAESAGFRVAERPAVRLSQAVLFTIPIALAVHPSS